MFKKETMSKGSQLSLFGIQPNPKTNSSYTKSIYFSQNIYTFSGKINTSFHGVAKLVV